MRAVAAALLFLSVSTVSVSAAIHLDPINPTERTFVTLRLRERWPKQCVPHTPKVERVGQRFDVVFQPVHGFCYTDDTAWRSDVPIGMLAAGRYEVAVSVSGSAPIATFPLIVRHHEPQLVLEPRLIPTDKKTRVRITSPKYNIDFCKTGLEVLVDGVPVESSRFGCENSIELDPRAAGSVDVALVSNGKRYESFGAVHYVDPKAAPDPNVYERMLVPVVLNAEGAFGSSWKTRGAIYNRSFADIEWLPEVSRPLCATDDCLTKLAARSSLDLSKFGEHPDGLVLFVPRDVTPLVRFSNIVQTPRDKSQYGTEVRVIREQELRTIPFMIPDVPFDSRYRVQLRVYGVDGATMPVYVGVTVGENYWAQHPIEMKAPCTVAELPCNSNAPAYGFIDLGTAFPWLFNGKANPIYVYPGASDQMLRYWAFVSITDNVTQHVTIITPH